MNLNINKKIFLLVAFFACTTKNVHSVPVHLEIPPFLYIPAKLGKSMAKNPRKTVALIGFGTIFYLSKEAIKNNYQQYCLELESKRKKSLSEKFNDFGKFTSNVCDSMERTTLDLMQNFINWRFEQKNKKTK